MPPSLEPVPGQPLTDTDRMFAAKIFKDLLHRIAAPPSNRTWGLARDTRGSLINPSRWNDADDPAYYYYLLDLEENWTGGSSREPGENPDLIWWSGEPATDLPEHLSVVPEAHRYIPPKPDPSWVDHIPQMVNEPRRYADPNGPLPPGVRRSAE
jgi:hypothetical protein